MELLKHKHICDLTMQARLLYLEVAMVHYVQHGRCEIIILYAAASALSIKNMASISLLAGWHCWVTR